MRSGIRGVGRGAWGVGRVMRSVGRGMWGVGLLIAPALAQDPGANVEQRVRQIVEQRPRQAEMAARAFLFHIARDRFRPAPDTTGYLDSLKRRDAEVYWREVAQLAVQFDIFQNVHQRDSLRAGLMGRMFGIELQARDIQRSWRSAGESERLRGRARLQELMTQHFDIEDQLRMMEMRDIERRLREVGNETERRRLRKAELVRWRVDDIIRDAERPEL